MPFKLDLTVVSVDLVYTDYKLLVEMTDGAFLTFACPWGDPLGADVRGWKNLTRDEVMNKMVDFNFQRRHNTNHSLHQTKVQKYGQDYARRGY